MSHITSITTHIELPNVPPFENIEMIVKKTMDVVCQFVLPAQCAGRSCELSLRVSDDDEIRTLNKNYRNKDKATNVLSFPNEDEPFEHLEEFCYLGDIIISIDTLEREASEQNIANTVHFIHLLIHGALHLFGLDHIKDEEAEIMEDLEVRILASLDIKNPYIINE